MPAAAISRWPCARDIRVKTADVETLYRNLGIQPPADISSAKPSKYSARKKEIDGHIFDSTGEAEAYRVLKQWERAGAITNLELQPTYILQPKQPNIRQVAYRPDFQFMRDGRQVVIDFKGMKTPVYRLKIKLFRSKFPFVVFEEWTRETLRGMR